LPPTWLRHLGLRSPKLLARTMGVSPSYSSPHDIFSLTKISMSSSTLGVHNALGDTLAVKVRKLVNEMEILEEDGAKLAGGHRVLVVVHRVAYISSS
jgi:hypothetical protein